MDKDGNIKHTRSGNIIKKWVEHNRFTGSGEYITPNSDYEENDRKSRKKMIERATKQYNCKNCENYVELRFGGFWCHENYTGEISWDQTHAYAQRKGLCF